MNKIKIDECVDRMLYLYVLISLFLCFLIKQLVWLKILKMDSRSLDNSQQQILLLPLNTHNLTRVRGSWEYQVWQ